METMKRPRGRPVGIGRKPPEEKYRLVAFRVPPAFLARFTAAVPSMERSAFIRDAVEERLERLEEAA